MSEVLESPTEDTPWVPPTVTVYTKPRCVQCDGTKFMLKRAGIEYTEVDLSQNPDALAAVKALGYLGAPVVITNRGTDPNDDIHWGGMDPDRINEHILGKAAA